MTRALGFFEATTPADMWGRFLNTPSNNSVHGSPLCLVVPWICLRGCLCLIPAKGLLLMKLCAIHTWHPFMRYMMNQSAQRLSASISSSRRSPKKISRRSYGGRHLSSTLNQFTRWISNEERKQITLADDHPSTPWGRHEPTAWCIVDHPLSISSCGLSATPWHRKFGHLWKQEKLDQIICSTKKIRSLTVSSC